MSTNKYEVTVVNRRTYQGKDARYVGRPTPLGNPFTAKQHGGRDNAIAKYKAWLNLQYRTGNSEVIDYLTKLARCLKRDGKIVLSCWCAPKACHASIVGQAMLALIDKDLL